MEFSDKSLNLKWEKAAKNSNITAVLTSRKKRITPVILKKIAISKMTDVNLISAEFNQLPVSFCPIFSVLMDTSSSLTFFGVYAADFLEVNLESENITIDKEHIAEYINSPLICVRKAVWNKDKDIENFRLADDKIQYVLGASQIDSDTLFLDLNQGESILKSIIQIAKLWINGLAFEKSTQNKTVYDRIKITISEGGFYLDFSYYPYIMTNHTWESWLDKWCKYFDKFPMSTGYVPDESFKISYQSSLLEQIENLMV